MYSRLNLTESQYFQGFFRFHQFFFYKNNKRISAAIPLFKAFLGGIRQIFFQENLDFSNSPIIYFINCKKYLNIKQNFLNSIVTIVAMICL